MKYLKLLLALLLVGMLGCSGDTFTGVQPDDQAIDTEPAAAAKNVAADITVYPSGDVTGVTDADAIENALNAAAPGNVIELAAGVFYLNRTLAAPTGFSGTLRGTGTDDTLLEGVGDTATPFGNALVPFPGSSGLFPGSSFIFFPEPCDLRVADLTTYLPEGFTTEPGGSADNLTAFFPVTLGPDDCNTTFDEVELHGTTATPTNPDPFLSHQPWWGIVVQGDLSVFPGATTGGAHVVSNSVLEKISVQSIVYEVLQDAAVTISGNTLRDQKQMILRLLDHADVLIERNAIAGSTLGGVVVTQEGLDVPGAPSNVVIRHNTIHVDGFAGIEVGNLFAPAPLKPDFNLLIEKNTITKGDDPLGFFPNFSGLHIVTGEEGAMVRNNIIRGGGFFGIYAGDLNQSTFVGNNLQGFSPSDADYGFFFSQDNTVVGRGNGTVVDFGGSGNIITGLSRVPGESIGERLREAQQRRKEILEAIGPGS